MGIAFDHLIEDTDLLTYACQRKQFSVVAEMITTRDRFFNQALFSNQVSKKEDDDDKLVNPEENLIEEEVKKQQVDKVETKLSLLDSLIEE